METTFPTSSSTSTDNSIRRNGEGMVDRLAQTAHAAVDRVASTAGPAIDRMRDTASTTAESLQSHMSDLSEYQSRSLESARGYVREKPITALAMAALAGMVLARWMR